MQALDEGVVELLQFPIFRGRQQVFQPLLGGLDAVSGFAHPFLPAQELQVQQSLDFAQTRASARG